MILGSFLLLNACQTQNAESKPAEAKSAIEKKIELESGDAQAQNTESKAPKTKIAVEKISVDQLLVELGDGNFKTRKAALKKAKTLPVEKIQELHKKLMASDDPEFRHVAGKLAPFIQEFLFNEVVAQIPRIADAKFAALKGLAEGSKAAQDRQREAAKTLPLEIILKKSGIVFRLIPAGKFTMGSPKTEKHRINSETQKQTEVTTSFYMGKFEVTQEQWVKVMGDTLADQNAKSNFPMYQVSWDDCQDFIKKLSVLEGLTNNLKLSLPAEIEWEYACRAGTQTAFYTGTTEADLAQAGWYGFDKGNSNKTTHEVGQKLCNAFGLYDMHGNVLEWCDDWYSDNRSYRVYRGGSWNYRARRCRSADRSRRSPGNRYYYLGLRLVLSQSVKK